MQGVLNGSRPFVEGLYFGAGDITEARGTVTELGGPSCWRGRGMTCDSML